MYFAPAPATISEFEIWGAEIRNVKGKITTTISTTTTASTTTSMTTTTTTEATTTAPSLALMEAIPSFQIPGIYKSSPAYRDFITMFQEIGPEFSLGFRILFKQAILF